MINCFFAEWIRRQCDSKQNPFLLQTQNTVYEIVSDMSSRQDAVDERLTSLEEKMVTLQVKNDFLLIISDFNHDSDMYNSWNLVSIKMNSRNSHITLSIWMSFLILLRIIKCLGKTRGLAWTSGEIFTTAARKSRAKTSLFASRYCCTRRTCCISTCHHSIAFATLQVMLHSKKFNWFTFYDLLLYFKVTMAHKTELFCLIFFLIFHII